MGGSPSGTVQHLALLVVSKSRNGHAVRCAMDRADLQESDAQNMVHEAHSGSLLSWQRGLRGTCQLLDA